jgi:Trk K+ transport system NAD-binding subunit
VTRETRREGHRQQRCPLVMAVTSDDLANIQCGLTARELSPGARVVMRIFDAHLAERLDRSVDLDLTRSVSALAAPAFTAALLDRPLAERTIHDVNSGSDLRVLAVDGRWRPRDTIVIEPGIRLAVVGTRDGRETVLGRRDR